MNALFLLLFLVQDDLEPFLQRLSDPSIEIREKAARDLVEVGARAIPPLEKLAQSGDPELKERATWVLRKIDARRRAAELGLDKLVPAEMRAKVPDLLDRAAGGVSEKIQLHEDLWAAVEAGTIKEVELTWIGALLKGPVNAKLRSLVYVEAVRWWYESEEAKLQEVGRQILGAMGEELLRDWPRTLTRLADSPNLVPIFDPDVIASGRGSDDDGAVSAAAIAELVQIGGPEIAPILIDIATDAGAAPEARKAAVQAVGALYKKEKR